MNGNKAERIRRFKYYWTNYGIGVARRQVVVAKNATTQKQQPKPIEDDYETLTEANQHTLDNYKGPSE